MDPIVPPPEAADSNPVDAVAVLRHIAAGSRAGLPGPVSIAIASTVVIAVATIGDLTAWADWLGAPIARVDVYDTSIGQRPMMRRSTIASTSWRGWTISVRLIESVTSGLWMVGG